MFSAHRTVSLIAFLALLTAAPAFTQTPSDEATPDAKAAAPAAYVYVQTTKGVDVYAATAAGKLTLVKGSPFSTSGQMEGNNGKYVLSVGSTNIHAYAIESNGAVGKQASNTNTQNLSGSECGNTDGAGAFLDHTGKHFYVQLFGNGAGNCAAWQSYQVQTNGELTFANDIEYFTYFCDLVYCGPDTTPSAWPSSIPTVSSNDNYAYGVFGSSQTLQTELGFFSTFVVAPDGLITVNNSFSETDPLIQTGGYSWEVMGVNADPFNHLAVLLCSEYDPPAEPCGPNQLASYTINDTTGEIISTNTWEDMPIPKITNIIGMRMSPSGQLLALSGYPGLQIFHFNGAAPITSYSKLLLPAVDIDQLAWDNDNHLYALSYTSGELYVYTATPTEIKEVSGSPYKVKSAYGIKGLIVVPKL